MGYKTILDDPEYVRLLAAIIKLDTKKDSRADYGSLRKEMGYRVDQDSLLRHKCSWLAQHLLIERTEETKDNSYAEVGRPNVKITIKWIGFAQLFDEYIQKKILYLTEQKKRLTDEVNDRCLGMASELTAINDDEKELLSLSRLIQNAFEAAIEKDITALSINSFMERVYHSLVFLAENKGSKAGSLANFCLLYHILETQMYSSAAEKAIIESIVYK